MNLWKKNVKYQFEVIESAQENIKLFLLKKIASKIFKHNFKK